MDCKSIVSEWSGDLIGTKLNKLTMKVKCSIICVCQGMVCVVSWGISINLKLHVLWCMGVKTELLLKLN